jgi:hypothetical protein
MTESDCESHAARPIIRRDPLSLRGYEFGRRMERAGVPDLAHDRRIQHDAPMAFGTDEAAQVMEHLGDHWSEFVDTES